MNEATSPQGGCPVIGHGSSLLSRSLGDPDILSRPHDYYAALRREDPVHYDDKLGMFMVSRYQDLQTVLRDPVTFSQEKGMEPELRPRLPR
jgi:cytochrome P450